MVDSSTTLDILIGLNVAIYAAVILGWFRARTYSLPKVESIQEALQLLERRLKRAFPDLPDGFTWREVVSRLRGLNLHFEELDWDRIESLFQRYEEYRFGGNEQAIHNMDVRLVLKLAVRLPKGEKFAPRS